MKRDDIPFQRHAIYYLILKYAVIAAAVVIAAYIAYRTYSG
jgi:nitrogen fixation protein FixH